MSSATEQRIKELTSPENDGERRSQFRIIKRFILKGLAFLVIYILGYNGYSIAWLFLPFLLTIIRKQEKKEREFSLGKARQISFKSEKDMIESRTKEKDLPPWVFFPEKVKESTKIHFVFLQNFLIILVQELIIV